MTQRTRNAAAFAARTGGSAPRPSPHASHVLAPVHRLSLETVASRSGLHPEMVRRLVTLGLLEAHRDADGRLWFPPSAPLALARIERLRAGFCLNYASLGLVVELLERIAVLEAELHRRGVRSEDPSWI